MCKELSLYSSLKRVSFALSLCFLLLTGCKTSKAPIAIQAPPPEALKVPPKVTQPMIKAPDTPYDKVVSEIRDDFTKNDFAAIEQKSNLAIKNKERFDGGAWKIRAIQGALSTPSEGKTSTEEDWKNHFAKIDNWIKNFPNSISAYTTLAISQSSYAQQGRGEGYANQISDEQFRLFKERLKQTEDTLEKASDLKDKSPTFYEQLLVLGIGQGWSRDRFDEVFNEAIKFEPDYQYFYRLKAQYLLPRWHGAPGEWEDFAEETMNKIGGKKGVAMYYQIVSNMSRYYGRDFFTANRIDWAKTIEGFAEFEKVYGMSREKLNEFGRLADHRGDPKTACYIFKQLGPEDYEEDVWNNPSHFLAYRARNLAMCGN